MPYDAVYDRRRRARIAAMGVNSTYLLLVEFSTDDAAPPTNPYVGEVGELAVVDTASRMAVAGGEALPNGATVTNGDPSFSSSVQTRVAGLAYKARVKRVSAYDGGAGPLFSPMVSWSTVLSSANTAHQMGISFTNSAVFGVVHKEGTQINLMEADASDIYFDFVIVLRADGWFGIINNRLVCVMANETTASLYAYVMSLSLNRHPPGIDRMAISQLRGSWATDTGIADYYNAAPSVNDLFTHSANLILNFKIGALPSAGSYQMAIRMQDASNYWLVDIASTGTVSVQEVVAGTPTSRASIASCANNDFISVTMDDVNLRIGRQRAGGMASSAAYSAATNFKTQTSGKILSAGTGGSMTLVGAFPKDLSGSVLTQVSAF